jgi:hypothetical protein
MQYLATLGSPLGSPITPRKETKVSLLDLLSFGSLPLAWQH